MNSRIYAAVLPTTLSNYDLLTIDILTRKKKNHQINHNPIQLYMMDSNVWDGSSNLIKQYLLK